MASVQKEVEVEGEKQATTVVDQEKVDSYLAIFEKAFRDGQPPYAGDLENETYKGILAKIRDFVANP
jgi:hypothetical protein